MLKPDLIVQWKNQGKTTSRTAFPPSIIGEDSANHDHTISHEKPKTPEDTTKRVVNRSKTVGEHLKKVDCDVQVGEMMWPGNPMRMPLPGMMIPANSMAPFMLPMGGINPMGGIMSAVDPHTGMFLPPGMSPRMPQLLHPTTTSESLEPSVMSGVSGLLSLAKGVTSSPGPAASSVGSPASTDSVNNDIVKEAALNTALPSQTVRSEAQPVLTCSQATNSQTNVTQSIKMNTPIMSANHSVSNTGNNQSGVSMPLMLANQNSAPSSVPFTGPLQGNLVFHNGQLILVNNDANLQTLNQNIPAAGKNGMQPEGIGNTLHNVGGQGQVVIRPQTGAGSGTPVASQCGPIRTSQPGVATSQPGGMTSQSGVGLNQTRPITPSVGFPGNIVLNNQSQPTMIMNNQGQLIPAGNILGQPGLAMQGPGMAVSQPGMMTMNTTPSQPNQLPNALILPNGQIVPVVTQPSLLFPNAAQSVPGGIIMPTGNTLGKNAPPGGMAVNSAGGTSVTSTQASQPRPGMPFGPGLLMTSAATPGGGNVQLNSVTAASNLMTGNSVLTASNHFTPAGLQLSNQPRLQVAPQVAPNITMPTAKTTIQNTEKSVCGSGTVPQLLAGGMKTSSSVNHPGLCLCVYLSHLLLIIKFKDHYRPP